MTYIQAKTFLDANMENYIKKEPLNFFFVAPALNNDLIKFIADIQSKGFENIDVKNYSTNQKYVIHSKLK